MELKPCARCHQHLCATAPLCLQCAAQENGVLPDSLVEQVSGTAERRCELGHIYTGHRCLDCIFLEHEMYESAIEMERLRLLTLFQRVVRREPVPGGYYFESNANWEV